MKDADIRLPHRSDRMLYPGHLHRNRGDQAIWAGRAEATTFEAGIGTLLRKTGPDGVICYTFLKAVSLCCHGDDHGNDEGTGW